MHIVAVDLLFVHRVHEVLCTMNLSTSYQSKYTIMIIGNTDAAAATSTVGSNANGKGSRHLMSKPSGRKWQARSSKS